MRGIIRRISASSLLWFGLMVWALGQIIVFVGVVGGWPDVGGPDSIVYDAYRFCSAIGAFFIFIGALLKVIGSLRAD